MSWPLLLLIVITALLFYANLKVDVKTYEILYGKKEIHLPAYDKCQGGR